jgi:hypothetical protein
MTISLTARQALHRFEHYSNNAMCIPTQDRHTDFIQPPSTRTSLHLFVPVPCRGISDVRAYPITFIIESSLQSMAPKLETACSGGGKQCRACMLGEGSKHLKASAGKQVGVKTSSCWLA